MCGIAGVVPAAAVGPRERRSALCALRHRGPDEEGEVDRDGAWLGVRRLRVIDLEGGRQPIANEDGSAQVVLNGEIYNYRELARGLRATGHRLRTRSDTEVLVHLYEDQGDRLCESLRGMFAFALWDGRARRLLLGRDRFGKKPLFYCHAPGRGLVFASELKALRPLLASLGQPLRIRSQGISDYLSLGYVPQPETIYEGVHAVPPASTLCFDGITTRTQPYWSLDGATESRAPYREAVARTRHLVSESVELRLRADVPVGVFLSGGVDSSVVAYEASRRLGGQLRTFTVSMGDADLDESGTAARTAAALGAVHQTLRLEVAPREELEHLVAVFDQPFADPSAIPSLAVARAAREHVTVVLNGDGGDEVFAGYRRYLAARWGAWLGPCGPLFGACIGWLRQPSARRTAAGFLARFARGLRMRGGARYLAWTSDLLREHDKLGALRVPAPRATESLIEQLVPRAEQGLRGLLRADRAVNLLSDLLVKMDMATSAASVEARSPLLDHRLAEFVAEQPPRHLLRRCRLKALLRDAYRGHVSDEVIEGRKRGFEVPLRRWLDGPLQPLLRETVGASDAALRDHLDGALVDGIVDGSRLQDRNGPALQYALLVLELWLRQEARRS